MIAEMIPDRVYKLLSRLTTPEAIKDRLSTMIGFEGVLLGLLVNAITSIDITKYQDVEPWLNYAFLVAVCCLLLSILIGLAASFKISYQSKDTFNASNFIASNLLYSSLKWLIFGILSVTLTISMLITKSFIGTGLFFVITIIILVCELYLSYFWGND